MVGSAADPTGPVNLHDWIIDDNNGDWEGSTTGAGTAPGYARFDAVTDSASCSALSSVNPGSIIVVYNANDPNLNLPADDSTDSNNDGVFILPAQGSCMKTCSGPPNSSDSGYSSCAIPANSTYSPLALRNGGDVAQARDINGTLFHGFTYGDIATPYPSGSFNVATGSASGSTLLFSCGSWFDGTNFSKGSATADTPGADNNAQNTIFRSRIQEGSFDYTNLGNPQNCAAPQIPILAVAENFPEIDGVAGGITSSVLASDTLDGNAVQSSNVTLTVGISDQEITLDENTRLITIAANTPAGTYSVEYTICQSSDLMNCSTITETVTVFPTADFSITKTNTLGLNGDEDQPDDTLTSGQTTRYSLTVANNGPDKVAGALLTDNIVSGLTCNASNPLTLTGNGAPSGSFTVASLVGAGVTLDMMANGDVVTISYDCIVD